MTALFERDPRVRRTALGSPSGFLAFGFGAGLVRYAPGTVGTAVAAPIALAFNSLPPVGHGIALVLLFAFGVWLCELTARRLGEEDPGGIVWDEMVGYWATVAFVPADWLWWLLAFGLFRAFDILKPWPIRWVEAKMRGGLGIMLDDLVAAAYAVIILALLRQSV